MLPGVSERQGGKACAATQSRSVASRGQAAYAHSKALTIADEARVELLCRAETLGRL